MSATGNQKSGAVNKRTIRKLPGKPGGKYELHFLDSRGRTVLQLTHWYSMRKGRGSDSTRETYLDRLLLFTSWQISRGHSWDAEPEEIRSQVLEYLRDELGCMVRADTLDGEWVSTSSRSPVSDSTLSVTLAAVKDLYDICIREGLYAYGENPMVSGVRSELRRVRLGNIPNAGAPDVAGIRGESWEQTARLSTAFFRQLRRNPWRPEVALMSPDYRLVMHQAVRHMISAACQRDAAVLQLMYDSGARLHEILALTARGWRQAEDTRRAMVRDKGSDGHEIKTLFLRQETVDRVERYIRGDRALLDPAGRREVKSLKDNESIFLCRHGRRVGRYTRHAFGYNWGRLWQDLPENLKTVPFSPHAIRHLFVTEMLRMMRQQAQGDQEEYSRLRSGLISLMAWRSERTIAAYDHSLDELDALEVYTRFQDAVRESVTKLEEDGGRHITEGPNPVTPQQLPPSSGTPWGSLEDVDPLEDVDLWGA